MAAVSIIPRVQMAFMEDGMSDIELDAKKIEEKVSDLAQAMDRVRNDQAERDDVVVDMKQASHARLELLAQDLQPVFLGDSRKQ